MTSESKTQDALLDKKDDKKTEDELKKKNEDELKKVEDDRLRKEAEVVKSKEDKIKQHKLEYIQQETSKIADILCKLCKHKKYEITKDKETYHDLTKYGDKIIARLGQDYKDIFWTTLFKTMETHFVTSKFKNVKIITASKSLKVHSSYDFNFIDLPKSKVKNYNNKLDKIISQLNKNIYP